MLKNWSKLFNPAGGLTYHYRALRYKNLWQPFCDHVARWLNEWNPAASRLVLVGPSAGYTLPDVFLRRFAQLIVVEPDPAAFMLFQSRFMLPAMWVREDFFGLTAKRPDPKRLRDLFSRFAGSSFLFCNVLGQLPVILRERGCESSVIESYMQELGVELRAAIQNNAGIASYHDRYSQTKKRPNEVIDHLTGELFAGLAGRKEFPWQLTPAIEHHVEFWQSSTRS